MALLTVNDSSLTSVANALRSAGNTSQTLLFPQDFLSAIRSISSEGGSTVEAGFQNVAQSSSFSLPNLPFTPTNALLLLLRRSTTKGVLVCAVSDSGYTENNAFGIFTSFSSGYITNISSNGFVFGPNSMIYTAPSTFNIYGLYFYLVWRDTGDRT